MSSPLGRAHPHESGLLHVTGEARYVDDLPEPAGLLHGVAVVSPHARARFSGLDATAALASPGVFAVLTASDVPGANQIGAVAHDEPLFAVGEVHTEGQVVALVLAASWEQARAAAAKVAVAWEPLPAVLTMREALAQGSFQGLPHVIARGDVEAALAGASLVVEGELENGGQDHFYLETHASLAWPEEQGTLRIASSTQHPSEVQAKVCEVLGLPRHHVVVDAPRMGGGFGGKETQAAAWAALAALGAVKSRRPVKVWLNRDQDMVQTGKRHPFLSRYRAGFSADGRLVALDAELYADGGWALDLSRSILDRALFHATNAYHVPHVRLRGRVLRTNKASNTAFRGFGGPQGMLLVEEALDRAAARLGLDPAELRRRNYYGPVGEGRDETPYGQPVEHGRAARIHAELLVSADYERRRAAIDAANARSEWVKRGIALAPVQFGISFTHTPLNQAGALVVVYADGTVQVNHGGTEMGQGLHTKMRVVAAEALGVGLEQVRVMTTSTEKVPNTSATAASSGSDLNGQAVRVACEELRGRLQPVAARLLGCGDGQVEFRGGVARGPKGEVRFAEVAAQAWLQQISLAATGYYRTPGIHYDAAAGRGRPFFYFAYGAAVVEVELQGLTGEHRLVRVDVLQDVGASLVPSIDRGQIEGAFVQGHGWLTLEELRWSREGRLLTHAPSTYKIPAVGDAPLDFRVRLLAEAAQPGTVHGSKAVGEPPFMLALGVPGALRHAIAAFGPKGHDVRLRLPATGEALLDAIDEARAARQR